MGGVTMKKFLLLLLVSLMLTSCYTNGDCITAVKEAYPDNEIYRVDVKGINTEN